MTPRTKAGYHLRRRLSSRCGGYDQSCAAKLLQSLPNVHRRTVDIVMTAQFLREFGLVGTTPDYADLETHVPGILHSKMTKSAYSQNSDKVSGLRGRSTHGTEGREAGAKERRCIKRIKPVRDRNKAT